MKSIDTFLGKVDIGKVLKDVRSIAIVGLSPKKERPSNMVARYLMGAGFTIYPVNPGQTEILGEVCYPDLRSIPDPVEMVNIFRKSEDVLPIVEQAVAIGAKTVWMQLGIKNEQGAELAEKNGMSVVMDRCIKIDHSALVP